MIERLGITLPILQAPMAGVQDHRLAVAVSEAGGLGALPAAMLTHEQLAAELKALRAATARPFNLNFFCHRNPTPDATREAAWRAALAPFADPSLTVDFVANVDPADMASVLAVGEILYQAQAGYSFSYNPSPLTLGAIAYLVLFIPLVWLGRWVETRFAWKR